MSTTPPPGFGSYSQTYQTPGGAHVAVITAGFENVGAWSAFNARVQVSNAFNSAGRLCAPSQYSADWTLIETYALINTGGVLTSDVSNVSVVGTAAFDSPAPGTSIVILRRTAMAGRQFRGHIALPSAFIDDTEVDSAGVITPGVVSSIQAVATSTLLAMIANTVPMVLLHGPPKVGATPPPTPVNTLTVTSLVGSQRRRLRG